MANWRFETHQYPAAMPSLRDSLAPGHAPLGSRMPTFKSPNILIPILSSLRQDSNLSGDFTFNIRTFPMIASVTPNAVSSDGR